MQRTGVALLSAQTRHTVMSYLALLLSIACMFFAGRFCLDRLGFSWRTRPLAGQCLEFHYIVAYLKVSMADLRPACLSKYLIYCPHQGCVQGK